MKVKIIALTLCMPVLYGCYSSARHIANVRPSTIKPDTTLATKYKLDRIVLKKSSFSRKVADASAYASVDLRSRELLDLKNRMINGDADAYIDFYKKEYSAYVKLDAATTRMMRDTFLSSSVQNRQKIVEPLVKLKLDAIERERKEYDKILKDDKKSGPNGTHYADTQMIFNSVHAALFRNYPSVFVDAADSIPIAVVIDWATEYKQLPDYASIFSGWLWPTAAEQESVYHLYVVENPSSRTDDELWNSYIAAPKKYPLPPECGFATRKSEVWESELVLPTGFIPCPGESDFPKTFCFMRSGKDSLVYNPSRKIESRECFKHMVFEPKVDGDVIAAAIVRVLNRKHRIAEAASMMKGGAR